MREKILITGGCGFIGSNLVSLLQETSDADIRVLDNESLGHKENLDEWDVEFIKGDLRDIDQVRAAVRGMDAVVHLAADTRVMDSIEDPYYNFQVNVVGTANLLFAMREAGVARIVNASTGGAILGEVPPPVREDMVPAPQSPYGASKLAVEGYLSAFAGSYGMRACSLRFANVYGPRSAHKGSVVAAFLRNIADGKPLVIYGDGSQTRDYVYILDICRGIFLALKQGAHGVYQLGSGVPTSLNELVEAIRATTKRSAAIRVEYKGFRSGELRHTWCDISKARRDLNYKPSIDLRKGLYATWKWFMTVNPH